MSPSAPSHGQLSEIAPLSPTILAKNSSPVVGFIEADPERHTRCCYPAPRYDVTRTDSIPAERPLSSKEALAVRSDPESHSQLHLECINTIRFLCIDAIERAKSGHPGICMGMAPAVFALFDFHLRFNPRNPSWLNRDRFVLSAGHGSMLQYVLLHLYGYESVSLADLAAFRTLNSVTPGHPESTITQGVEVCTGPLGQGFCNAVGFAIAESHVAAQYNRPNLPIVSNYTYCLVGDGCMMEGMVSEGASLAGHLGLGKLIVLYDDNHISIDGPTETAFTEDVAARFASYGWHVQHVTDGNTDMAAIESAIHKAKQCCDKPSLIKITTTIGFGSPNKAGSADAHGSSLGPEEIVATRKALGWRHGAFDIPPSTLKHFRAKVAAGAEMEASWICLLDEYRHAYPSLAKQFESSILSRKNMQTANWEQNLMDAAASTSRKSLATRQHSQTMLNVLCPLLPNLLGGAADTSPSTLTDIDCAPDFTAKCRLGRNIRFGVREHAMAAITNGLALSGYSLIPFCATFFVFTDYMRAAMRMASLSCAQSIFICTHDSVALGEDGPSHMPSEHLASFRAMPNHAVWRPADANETAAAFAVALQSKSSPSTLVLSRQKTAVLPGSSYQGAKCGAYIVFDSAPTSRTDGVMIATGSEVALAVEAAQTLAEHLHIIVVSMPCWSQFEQQSWAYRSSVLPISRTKTMSVEAASSFGWARYADHSVSVDTFGRSGPGSEVMSSFGFTVDAIAKRFQSALTQAKML